MVPSTAHKAGEVPTSSGKPQVHMTPVSFLLVFFSPPTFVRSLYFPQTLFIHMLDTFILKLFGRTV